jgi:hypothetical protein
MAFNIANYRQITVAIAKKHIKDIAGVFDMLHNTTATAYELIVAWQTTHSIRVNLSQYGLEKAYPTKLQPALIEQYRRVSQHWHRFLKFDVPSPIPQILKILKEFAPTAIVPTIESSTIQVRRRLDESIEPVDGQKDKENQISPLQNHPLVSP